MRRMLKTNVWLVVIFPLALQPRAPTNDPQLLAGSVRNAMPVDDHTGTTA